jgi:hypothetical protein
MSVHELLGIGEKAALLILQNLLDKEKVRDIDLAFTHLTELITGQAKHFKPWTRAGGRG